MEEQSRGFTLIEILLALSILTIVCVIFLQVMTNSCKIWLNENSYLTKNHRGRIGLQTIINQLRMARDINISNNNEQIEFRCYYHNDKMKWLKYGLYTSGDVQALGVKKADYSQAGKDYSNYTPLINRVTDIEFIKTDSSVSIYKVKLKVKDSSGNNKEFFNCVVPE